MTPSQSFLDTIPSLDFLHDPVNPSYVLISIRAEGNIVKMFRFDYETPKLFFSKMDFFISMIFFSFHALTLLLSV